MAPSSHPEVQEVQESDLARYGGWHEQQGTEPESSTQASGPVPLLDEADHVTPEQFQQDRPWWMRPIPRMIFAGSAVMALVYVLFSWFGLWGSASVDKPGASLMPTDTVALNQEVDSRIRQLQAENENLKRTQVMGDPLPTPSSPSQPTKPVSIPPSSTVVNTPAPRVVYVTQPSTASRSIPYTLPPPKQSAPVMPKQSAPVKTELEIDPMKQWQMAANAGSFGSDSANRDEIKTTHAQTTNNSQGNVSNPIELQTRGNLGTHLTLRPQIPQSQIPQSEGSYQLNNYPSDPSARLMVGTRAAGEIDVPISWSGNSSQSSSLPNLRIKLVESLKTAEGREVIPAGSFLIVHVDGADNAGFLQLSAVSVQSKFSENESRLPEGAIRIFDKSGNPLRANYHGPKGKSLFSHVTDAAAIAGGVSGNSNLSSLYVLNGLQGSGQYSQSQSTYFSLERRTRVELYVNQSFSPIGVP